MSEVQNKAIGNVIMTKEEVYKDVFDRYYVRLCYYAQTFVADFDVCKDIVQDVFVKLWEAEIGQFSNKEVDKFLYRSVKNRCFDYLRKQKVRQNSRLFILERLLDDEEVFIPQLELDELTEKIEKVLSKLPEQTLMIFKMSRNEDKSYAEIAEEMDMSVKGVEYHMSKALAMLRFQLKDYLPLMAYLSMFLDKS